MAKPSKYSNFKRKVNTRKQNRTILIFCGAEETEPNYFKAFKTYTSQVIRVRGIKQNTVPLIREALKYIKADKHTYDSVWCVFDKDDFTDFNDAIDLATSNGIHCAYSNKCFEVWLLMHFGKSPTGTPKQLESQLNQLFIKELNLKEGYKKNQKNLLELLKAQQSIAIQIAERHYEDRHRYGKTPQDQSPVTTVFKLVKELNANLRV